MLFRQAEKTRKSSPPTAALDLQEFGVDQRRLLKHSGSNSVRPVLFHHSTCCSFVSRPLAVIDDADLDPHDIHLVNLLNPLVRTGFRMGS